MAAVAFLGTTMYRDQWPAQDYYILCADGTLAMWKSMPPMCPVIPRGLYAAAEGNRQHGKRFPTTTVFP